LRLCQRVEYCQASTSLDTLQERDAVAAFKGTLQEEAAHSQQRLEASLKKIHQLEEEINRQSFLVSKAEVRVKRLSQN
jgi:hypothetical protein